MCFRGVVCGGCLGGGWVGVFGLLGVDWGSHIVLVGGSLLNVSPVFSRLLYM